MKVFRVTVSNQGEAGVVFDAGGGRIGRALVQLPPDVIASTLAVAQAAFDAVSESVRVEVQPQALTTALHKVRSAEQDHERVMADGRASLEKESERLRLVRIDCEQTERELEKKKSQLASAKGQLDAVQTELASARAEIAKGKP